MDVNYFFILLLMCVELAKATPVNTKSTENADNSDNLQTVLNDEVTFNPDMQKVYVDLGNVPADVARLLQKSKLNIDHIRELQEQLKNRYDVITSSTTPGQISQK